MLWKDLTVPYRLFEYKMCDHQDEYRNLEKKSQFLNNLKREKCLEFQILQKNRGNNNLVKLA